MGMVVAAAGIRGQRPEERRWQRHRRRDGTVYCGGGISVNNLVVEAGQFAGASQSEDRKSMVEDLLREYTANGAPVGGKQDVKQEGDPEDDGDDLLRSEMATSADELALYQRIDAQRQSRGHVLRNMEADEVPVWLTGETQPAAEARAAEARAAAAGASAGRAGRRSHARPSASFAYEAVGTPGALRVTLKRRQN